MKTNKNSGVTYTCPMHPEVVSDASGNCPKCGMKLVPKGGNMTGHKLRMVLVCLLPLIIILLLPLFGIRFNATWLIPIVLVSCCILPMLFMQRSGNKHTNQSS